MLFDVEKLIEHRQVRNTRLYYSLKMLILYDISHQLMFFSFQGVEFGSKIVPVGGKTVKLQVSKDRFLIKKKYVKPSAGKNKTSLFNQRFTLVLVKQT